MVPFRYNVRSLFVRKLTTTATALGIALVVFVYAASLMLKEGVRRAVATGGRTDNAIILRKGSDAELASAIANQFVNNFRAQPQIANAESVIGEIVIVVTAERSDGSGGISNLTVRGMPPNGIAFRPEVQIVSGRAPKPGTNEVIIGKGVTGRFLDPSGNGKRIEPGSSFDIKRNRPLEVVGVFSSDGSSYESEVWGDLDVVRKHAGREGMVSSARVRLKSADDFDAYKRAIEGDATFSMKVQREADYYADQSSAISGILGGLGLALAIMFSIAAMIGAAITMNAAVANRSREIGILRALGFSRLSILTSFVLEAILLSAIGGAIGAALVQLLGLVSFHIINFQTFSELVINFTATPAVFGSAMIFAAIMGFVGGIVPAIRASRISPVEAMRA
jgi:putative ABC transport system permease protein